MSKLIYILTIVILGLAFAYRISTNQVQKIPRNQDVKLSATIKAEPGISGGSQVIEIGDSKVYVDLYPRYKVGDRVLVEGEADSDSRIFRPKIQVIGRQRSLGSFFSGLRLKISQNIASYLPSREATIVSGTVLGVDTIERDFRDQLIKTGTIHVVVVSGQNLMIVAGVFLALGRYFGKRWSLILAVIAVFIYAALTGFEPPVVRASLMVLASTLAIFAGRQTFPIWQLVLAALVILFIWPQAVFEVSFQLTFAATLGIMTLGQRLANLGSKSEVRIPKSETNTNVQNSKSKTVLNLNHSNFNIVSNFELRISDFLIQNAAIATSAYLFTAPLILFYFGRISPLAPLANILIAEAVFPVMILGFLVSFVSLIFSPLAQALAYLAYVPALYFVKVVEFFAKIPITQVSLGKGSLFAVAVFYILLILLMVIWKRKFYGDRN